MSLPHDGVVCPVVCDYGTTPHGGVVCSVVCDYGTTPHGCVVCSVIVALHDHNHLFFMVILGASKRILATGGASQNKEILQVLERVHLLYLGISNHKLK